ncbi:TOBE domain-containing protein [Tritonibacter litoralis]
MGGQILQCAAPDQIYEDPADIQVAEFIGAPKINILPVATAPDLTLTLLGQNLPLRVARATTGLRLGLRPQALHLAGADARLTGIVAHTENLGAELFAQIEVPGLAQRLVMRAEPTQRSSLRLGAPVGIDFDCRAALVFDGAGQRVREVEHLAHLPMVEAL